MILEENLGFRELVESPNRSGKMEKNHFGEMMLFTSNLQPSSTDDSTDKDIKYSLGLLGKSPLIYFYYLYKFT